MNTLLIFIVFAFWFPSCNYGNEVVRRRRRKEWRNKKRQDKNVLWHLCKKGMKAHYPVKDDGVCGWSRGREGESGELFSWLCLPTAEKSPWEGYRTRAALLTGLNSLLPLSTQIHTDNILEKQSVPAMLLSIRGLCGLAWTLNNGV